MRSIPRGCRSAGDSSYAEAFDTLEINSTFYRLPRPEGFASWRRQAPPGFVYAVKMSRFATHMKLGCASALGESLLVIARRFLLY